MFSSVTTGPKESYDFCYCAYINQSLQAGRYCNVSFNDFKWALNRSYESIGKEITEEELIDLELDEILMIEVDGADALIFIRKSSGIEHFNQFLVHCSEVFADWFQDRLERRNNDKIRALCS